MRCFVDSGSMLDMVHSDHAMQLNLKLTRLDKPLKFKLGVEDKVDFASISSMQNFASGSLTLGAQPFYICPITKYNVILGTAFLCNANVLVGLGKLVNASLLQDVGEQVSVLPARSCDAGVAALDLDPSPLTDKQLYQTRVHKGALHKGA